MESAAAWAADQVAGVRENPAERLQLMASLYGADDGGRTAQWPFRRAAVAFLGWQVRRGVLDPNSGSAWWRAVNERLLLDTAEARASFSGHPGAPSSRSAEAATRFAHRPSARTWYHAHNASVVAGYLDHRDLVVEEDLVERFFIDLVLVRVLFAHALVAAPRLALSWWAPIAPWLGDPRVGMTGIFLSLSRVLPNSYPLGDRLEPYVTAEHGFGRLLDIGVVRPRLEGLFEWSAETLDEPRVRELLTDGVPSYACAPVDRWAWDQPPSLLARAARTVLPAPVSR